MVLVCLFVWSFCLTFRLITLSGAFGFSSLFFEFLSENGLKANIDGLKANILKANLKAEKLKANIDGLKPKIRKEWKP